MLRSNKKKENILAGERENRGQRVVEGEESIVGRIKREKGSASPVQRSLWMKDSIKEGHGIYTIWYCWAEWCISQHHKLCRWRQRIVSKRWWAAWEFTSVLKIGKSWTRWGRWASIDSYGFKRVQGPSQDVKGRPHKWTDMEGWLPGILHLCTCWNNSGFCSLSLWNFSWAYEWYISWVGTDIGWCSPRVVSSSYTQPNAAGLPKSVYWSRWTCKVLVATRCIWNLYAGII